MNTLKATAHRTGALYLLFLIVGLVDMFGFTGFLVPGMPPYGPQHHG